MVTKPRLRLSYSVSRFSRVWPVIRRLTVLALLAAVGVGGYRWILNTGTAGALEFSPHVVGVATDAVGVEGIATGDTDNDGDVDIVTAGLDGVKVYINNGSQKFEAKIVDSVRGERVQVIDFNQDGNLDLLVTIPDGNPGIKWYDNRGDNEFGKNELTITDGKKAQAYAGDINADGAPDIITATEEGGPIVLRRWMNNGGTFTPTILNSDSKVTTVTVGDIDGNGYKDIVTGGTNGLQRWHTTTGLTWSRIDIDDSKPNRTSLVVVDVNADDKADIITGDQVSNVVAVYTNQDNSAWQRKELSGDADALTVVARDLDEDGNTDIVVAAQDDNSVFWFKRDDQGEYTKQTMATNLQSVFAVAVVDLDDDNDFDFVASDHYRGTIYWYERTIAKPRATAPSSIEQSTDGTGRVTFKTTISDGDQDLTSIRVQYSKDGKTWYKPWLTKVTPSAGSVDLKNSLGYQIGTNNPIDTDSHDSVTLTLIWDTKSVENTGGPLIGDVKDIRLRIIPKDKRSTGLAVKSDAFRVDNQAPQGVGGLRATMSETSTALTWNKPSDSSAISYRVYFGTDAAAVSEQRAEVWDSSDDQDLSTTTTLDTIITGLENETTYNFKLVARDAFGNEAATSIVRGKTVDTAQTSSTPLPLVGTNTPLPTTTSTPVPSALFTPNPSVSPTPRSTPLSVLNGNEAPEAQAGPDQVVNPSALVILDGSSSVDSDRDTITFTWKQLSGPPITLNSDRTARPSFSAGKENETYILSLTVRDTRGATNFDTVTIATRTLPVTSTTPVQVTQALPSSPPTESSSTSSDSLLVRLLRPLNILLAALALASTGLLLAERLIQLFTQQKIQSSIISPILDRLTEQGRLVHYQTGQPIPGAQILIYDRDNKLRLTEKTNAQGVFSTSFPVGEYSIGIEAPGFAMASTIAMVARSQGGLVYTGGIVKVENATKPLPLIIPVKPTVQEISTFQTRFLHIWQLLQRVGRAMSWPLFIGGALLNTFLVFLDPRLLHLSMEVLYIILIIIKIAVEIRIRPAYGVVRDAITHVPLDLAVVRLVNSKTNRLVMTRVTNSQGKFFALPPPGTYTVTITKQGYGAFTRNDVEITDEHDATLQMTADLMPIVPHGGLQQARAAVI